MVQLPAEIPVTRPVAAFIVAFAGVLLLHTPLATPWVSMPEDPMQILVGPAIAARVLFTVTILIV
jgi:hypothetical protein